MSMFDTVGQSAAKGGRKENTLRKSERMNAALRHCEPDRVPISDFFWGSFVKRWREELDFKTGFGAVMHKRFEFPMPEMRRWETDTFDQLVRQYGTYPLQLGEFDEDMKPSA